MTITIKQLLPVCRLKCKCIVEESLLDIAEGKKGADKRARDTKESKPN